MLQVDSAFYGVGVLQVDSRRAPSRQWALWMGVHSTSNTNGCCGWVLGCAGKGKSWFWRVYPTLQGWAASFQGGEFIWCVGCGCACYGGIAPSVDFRHALQGRVQLVVLLVCRLLLRL